MTEERFWDKVDASGDCWLWTGRTGNGGYGYCDWPGSPSPRVVHRIAWEILCGPIPEDHQLDHLCRVTRCLNPDHLEPVTAAENMRRMYALKSHCKNGHPFSGSNLRLVPRAGHLDRFCRTCLRDATRRYREPTRSGNDSPATINSRRTECKNGHLFNEENTRVTHSKSGRVERHCKECSRQHVRNRRARLAAEANR